MTERVENYMESRRQAIQSELDKTQPAEARNRLGQFATPHRLAVEIAAYIDSVSRNRLDQIYFADPSIGTGSFFSAALEVFGSERIHGAVGCEIDERFCDAARQLWKGTCLDVLFGDFTKIVAGKYCPPAPNLILANPPYVRHHHLELLNARAATSPAVIVPHTPVGLSAPAIDVGEAP